MRATDIIQKIESNIKENQDLLDQFISSEYYFNILNSFSNIATPLETKWTNNKIIVKFHHLKHKNIGIKIHLSDVEITNKNFKNLFKEKLQHKVKEIDTSLKNIEDAASKILKQFDETKFK